MFVPSKRPRSRRTASSNLKAVASARILLNERARAAPNCSRRRTCQRAHERGLRECEQATDLERCCEADVFTAIWRGGSQLVAHVRWFHRRRIAVSRVRREWPPIPGVGGVAAASRLRKLDMPGCRDWRHRRPWRIVGVWRVRVLPGRVEHRAELGADQPDVEGLHERPEVALVGRGERPVSEHRETVSLFERDVFEVDCEPGRHFEANTFRRVSRSKTRVRCGVAGCRPRRGDRRVAAVGLGGSHEFSLRPRYRCRRR